MTDQNPRPIARGPLRPFLRRVLRESPSPPVFRAPSPVLRLGLREFRLLEEIVRAGRAGYLRCIETSPSGELTLELTERGRWWVETGSVFEEGYG